MFGYTYYFGTIRKYIVLFGTLFNDITVQRFDSSGNLLNEINVPIAYGPRERYLTRIEQNPDLLRQIDTILPRISFEIKSFRYAEERKLTSISRNKNLSGDASTFLTQFNPVPYDFDITMSVMTRNADDGTQIIEQILPFFKPEWTATINIIPEMNISMDIPVVIKSVSMEDNYENGFENRRAIVWTLEFTLKGYLYGPTSKGGVITQAITNLYDDTIVTSNTTPVFTSTITPGQLANGTPTTNASLSIARNLIQANSNYGFIYDFTENL